MSMSARKASQRLCSPFPSYGVFVSVVLALFAVSWFFPANASAFPIFSRQVGRDCNYCHTVIPKLNETGRIFMSNGFRFAAEEEWKEVRNFTTVPLSVEIELEGEYEKLTSSSGAVTEASDLVVEEVEFMGATAMGKTGKVSALTVVSFKQTGDTVKSLIEQAYIQVNDLAGPMGEGRLNILAGQKAFSMHFFGNEQNFFSNRYLVESALSLLERSERVIELNGVMETEEDSPLPTHRYALGIARESVESDDKLKGHYASYSATFKEDYSVGVIYRAGEEDLSTSVSGSGDFSYRKYGIAGQAEAGAFTFLAGFFKADRDGAGDLDNRLLELLVKPSQKFSFGARYDSLSQKDKSDATAYSFMVRYNILSNAYAQLEYDALSDDAGLAGGNTDEEKVKAFLVALF